MPTEKPKTGTPTNKPPTEDRAVAEARLNQAASDLLEQIPDHAGQLVHSLAKQYQMPLWQYTCGILLAVHLEGRLSEFRLDPAWKQGYKTKELVCKQCGKSFKPRHINQPYCTNECGLAASGLQPLPIDTSTIKDDSIAPVIANPTASKSAVGDSAPVGWSETTV